MNKSKLTRTLMAACSIVALSAVMYGCVHSGDDPAPPVVEPAPPVVEPTPDVDVELPADIPSGYEPAAGEYIVPAGAAAGSNGVWLFCEAGGEGCTVTIHADGSATADGDGGKVSAGLTGDAQKVLDDQNTANQDKMDKETRAAAQQEVIDDAVTDANAALAAVADPADASHEEVETAETAVEDVETAITAGADISESAMTTNGTTLSGLKTSLAAAVNVDDQRIAIAIAITAARTAVDGLTDTAPDAVVTDADTAIRAAKAAIAVATDVPAHETAANTATVDAIVTTLTNAKASRTLAMNTKNKAQTAKLGKLVKGIADAIGVGESATADSIKERKVTTKPTTGATDLDDPHVISGWAGTSYSTTKGSGISKETTTAVVYSNKEAPTPIAFNKRWATADNAVVASRDGVYTFKGGDSGKLVDMAGLPTHASHEGVTVGPVNGVRGTFDGVPGLFTSAANKPAGVKVSVDVNGNATWDEDSDLNFKPDIATATVMKADDAYMSLGWWLTEAADGKLTPEVAAWVPEDMKDYTSSNLEDLVGKATFQGIAVGKYTHKTINSIEGGHFNANAKLVANFDVDTLKGTIDGFMQDGVSIGSGWKVELGAPATSAASFDPEEGAKISQHEVKVTDSSAMGTFGTQKTMGIWNATFYDDTRNDKMPGAVGGGFAVGELGHPINMIGAFAASNQEADQPKK